MASTRGSSRRGYTPRMGRRLSRRSFLIHSAGGLAGLGLAACGDNLAGTAVSGLGIGIIGVGSQGAGHLAQLLGRTDVRIVAVADVDTAKVEAAVAMGAGIAGYQDYRELLARSDIDAVVVATPDHWHAKASIDAANAGRHVYCEKPVSLTIAEGRRMVEAVRANGIAFQTGSQQRSNAQFPLACEIVRNGRIGQLMSIEVAVWPGPFELPVPAVPVPATLDWDMWLGQAPAVPYHPWRAARTFRYFRDYAGGALADYGAHELDIAQWGAGYDRSGPAKVRATATFHAGNGFETPTAFDVSYTYANGVTVHLTTTDDLWFAQFFGSDGWVKVTGAGIEASRPEILEFVLGSGAIKLAGDGGHYDDWFAAIANGTLPAADVEIGHRTASMCHLANIAIGLGRELTWDPDAERFVGDAEADAQLSRPQRAPWML